MAAQCSGLPHTAGLPCCYPVKPALLLSWPGCPSEIPILLLDRSWHRVQQTLFQFLDPLPQIGMAVPWLMGWGSDLRPRHGVTPADQEDQACEATEEQQQDGRSIDGAQRR